MAARLGDEAFWAGLTRLGVFGISGDRLISFMSGSVAARLGDEAFWAGLTRLGELGISGDGLVTFMSGSVAARLEDEAFWAGLTRLGELGISGNGLVSFMHDGVAARLGDEAFWAGLTRLGEFGITGDGLEVSFMIDSVAARLDNHDFMDGLSSLCSELSQPVVIGLMKNNIGFRWGRWPAAVSQVTAVPGAQRHASRCPMYLPTTYKLKGVFSPNPPFFYKSARLAPYELTHVRASSGECAAGWAQAARKI